MRYPVGVGFERIDRIARDMAARKRGDTPRRGAPVRWAMLGLLAAVGIGGAGYFVGGSSGTKPPDPHRLAAMRAGVETAPAPERAPEPAPAPVPGPVAPPLVAPYAELPPEPPEEPAASLLSSTSPASAARAARVAVVLDDLDATLHGLRLTWPGKMGALPWRLPRRLDADQLERELAALDDQLAGAHDPLTLRTREWIAVARADGTRLLSLHAAWSAPGASADELAAELHPIFDRLVAASQALHAAVAAELTPPPRGTLARLASACRVAPLLARLPLRGTAAVTYGVEAGGPSPSPVPMPEPPERELRERATACAREALAFLDAHPGEALDHDVIYQLALANQLAVNLLREAERRRRPASPRAFVSAAGNLAQESAMLATARRRHDPSLPAADAPAAAAPPRRR